MKKIFLLLFLLLSLTLFAQNKQDTIVPTCQLVDTTEQVYVAYSVILFETTDSIDLKNITVMDDLVEPDVIIYFDPATFEAKNLCMLGLKDGNFFKNRFGFAEEFAKYLVDKHKKYYPNVKIMPVYSK